MKYRLLIAEDEETDRIALRLLLELSFPELEILPDATNGIELVDATQRAAVDIAIVDIDMPGLNGIDAVKLLREHGCETKVIVHTAFGEFDYALEAIKAHVFDYILKPMRRDKIVQTIRACIDTLDTEQSQVAMVSQLAGMRATARTAVGKELVHAIVSNTLRSDDSAAYVHLLGMSPRCGTVLCFRLAPENKIKGNDDYARLEEVLRDQLSQVCEGIASRVTSSEIVAFVPKRESPAAMDFDSWVLSLGRLLQEETRRALKVELLVGIGGEAETATGLHRSYVEASIALKACGRSKLSSYRELYTDDPDLSDDVGAPGSSYSKLVRDAVEYIQMNHKRDMSLSETAEAVGVSMYYLSRTFKQEVGQNFVDFLTHYRIERAKEHLSGGQHSVKTIAGLVGYNTHAYFCKLFRKFTGESPSSYRRRLRAGLEEE